MKVFDIHTHGMLDYDTTSGGPEAILKMSEFLGAEGVSKFLPTVYPASIETMRRNMANIKEAMRSQGISGAFIAGINLEGPFLNPVRSGALDESSFIAPSEKKLGELIEGFEDVVKIITIAPEMDGSPGLIRRIADMGIMPSMGHSDASYSEAEAGFKAGARGITHLFNAMSGFHHREPGLAGFGLINKDVYVEIIGDPYHLHPKTLEMAFRVKGAGRIILVSDSVKGMGRAEGPALGGRLGPDEVPDEGRGGLPRRLAGGSMPLTRVIERLAALGINKDVIIRCVSENPEAYLSS